jgi:hypothetical protein
VIWKYKILSENQVREDYPSRGRCYKHEEIFTSKPYDNDLPSVGKRILYASAEIKYVSVIFNLHPRIFF